LTELLLNIVWLLLAVPAVLIWLQARKNRPAPRGGICALLVLGCILLLLFPVISASDDLHAMRSEIEEASASKKIVMHVAAQAPHASTAWGGAALTVSAASIAPQIQVLAQVVYISVAFLQQAIQANLSSRAPPVFPS